MVKDLESLDAGGSQAVKAQLRLRELILAGELPAGSRIAELAIVERIGVSRTPIRAAPVVGCVSSLRRAAQS